MPHDHAAHGRNHAGPWHLHSHMPEEDRAAELQVLARQFIDGFRAAADKAAYLSIAGIPREIPGEGGAPAMKLVDVRLETEWQVGTASPAFGSRELSYLPFPGEMIGERENMVFVYVSLEGRRERDLREILRAREG